MTAAAWTTNAKDITYQEPLWTQHLSAAALGDLIGLSEATVLDTITRRITDPTDPRSAIVQPAARIGATKLAAMPRWTVEQADDYLELAERRDLSPRAVTRAVLPLFTAAEAKAKGLAGTRDLADLLGCAENTIRWWARAEAKTFPPEVGIAAREAGAVYGPPRALRSIAKVTAWVNASPERRDRLARSRAAAAKAAAQPATPDPEGAAGGRSGASSAA